jgi:hypothetical protein
MINRYVHQVGLYVRPKERAEIEAELRSQIQDELEDRYGSAPTSDDIAAVLKQLGDPRTMAASYGDEQYLVGPDLYPFLMMVLRFGLPLVPGVVVVANLVGAALNPQGTDWLSLLVGSFFTAGQMAIIFFAAVVGIFALLQQHTAEFMEAAVPHEFDPLKLPPVDEPGTVDRLESSVGIALGTLVAIALLYFLQAGGLTLRFNLSDPGDVLPVPTPWLIVLLITTVANVALNLWALVRRRWTFGTWLAQMSLELAGAVGLYHVLLNPVLERVWQAAPHLGQWLLADQAAAALTLLGVITIVLVSGFRLIRLWRYHQQAAA